MKKIFFLATILMALISCSRDNNESTPTEPKLILKTENLSFQDGEKLPEPMWLSASSSFQNDNMIITDGVKNYTYSTTNPHWVALPNTYQNTKKLGWCNVMYQYRLIHINGWNYLNGIITSNVLGKNYGQLPKEAEIAITCNLLEKERAIIGGSHFGHQPRVDDWEEKENSNSRFLTGNQEYLPNISMLHQNFVEWNEGSVNPNPSTQNSSVTKNRIDSSALSAASITQELSKKVNMSDLTKIPTTSGIVLSTAKNIVSNLASTPVNTLYTLKNKTNSVVSNVSSVKTNITNRVSNLINI